MTRWLKIGMWGTETIYITRATLANWIIKVGQSFIPLVNLIRDEILSSDAIQCDETPVQVLKENGIQTAKKRYMWVMGRAGPGPNVNHHEKLSVL